jgi:rhodanese-related sulfurtransferase
MAVGVLERLGFTQARNLEGGSEAWIAAGYPVLEHAKPPVAESAPVSVPIPTPPVPKKQVNLPERISASELKRLLMDLPNTFDLVDVRPAEHFRDYRLPGAVNVDVSDLLENPKYLVGVGPLVIVDRDGSIAMAIGGALSQKTKRTIKVLYNGLQDYWSQSGATMETQSSPAPLPAVATPPATQQQPAVPAQPPATPKKKSAGC